MIPTFDRESQYYKQVALVIEVLPFIKKDSPFAVKGGTALNLFIRNMPRLSVDIDLVYLPVEDRNTSLNNIGAELASIKSALVADDPAIQVEEKRTHVGKHLIKLFVIKNAVQIVIEPNTRLRGALYPIEHRDLCSTAETIFQRSVINLPVVSFADLYAGKICAALDRQHPRDLFDIKLLFDNEGLTDPIRQAFVIYLASCSRPMVELLDPRPLDVRAIYDEQFLGMTTEQVSYEELIQVREHLIQQIQQSLTDSERQFLLSLKQGKPRWELVQIPNVEEFPALKWKLLNIQKMEPNKHKQALMKLEEVLAT